MNIHTLSVHAGERLAATQPSDSSEGRFMPVVTPIYHSVGYTYDDTADLDAVFAGTSANPVYTRYGNPTVAALETALAALEGGEAALAYGSGMAAIHAALLAAGARAGTTVVAAHDVYGATYALLARLLSTQGVSVRFVDAADHAAVTDALAEAGGGCGRGAPARRPALAAALPAADVHLRQRGLWPPRAWRRKR